jgi:hypothetical protein
MSPGIAVLTIVGVYFAVAWGIAFWMGITGDDDDDMVYLCATLWPMYLIAMTIYHLGEFFKRVGKKLPSVKKLWNCFVLLLLPCRFGCKIRNWWKERKNETT